MNTCRIGVPQDVPEPSSSILLAVALTCALVIRRHRAHLKTQLAITLLAFAMTGAHSQAQVKLGPTTTLAFATAEEGRGILTSRDDFVQRMGPFDRAARLKTDRDVSEAEYLKFVGRNVLEWEDAEKEKITAAFQAIQTRLGALSLPFPKQVFVVKTTGSEEGDAAYTRANAIVLPKSDLTGPVTKIRKTLCHELFHILSRANPQLREGLYSVIGFVKCDEVEFPLELSTRKITNPDAPKNDHCIRLQVAGTEHWAIPILISNAEKYDVQRGGEFFNYLQFVFLLVDRQDKGFAVRPLQEGQRAKLVGMQQVSGFIEQVGRNTRYIIHPEEILADNFALWVLEERNLPSPTIVEKLEGILTQSTPSAAGSRR